MPAESETDRPEPVTPEGASRLAASIMESVADGVFAVDREWNITAFNPAAAAVTGIPAEFAIGRKCFDVLRANVCANRCPIREAIVTGGTVTNRNVTIINANGQEVPISISAGPLRGVGAEIVGGVETFRDLSTEVQLRKRLLDSYSYRDIIGKNAQMRQLLRILPAVAESESTVLIEGESGTGKELFARAIHDLSPRSTGPYVIVNCSALPENLLESELFGYKKGAFTDAKMDKSGRFELANGGSVFLDEVGTLPPAVQVKLLRVLEQKTFEPLGGTDTVKTDVRVIAATNRRLSELVREGRFQDGLFYRLNVVSLELPPLRDRRDDIPLLVNHFINHFNIEKHKEIRGITPGALQTVMEYDLPGNVRELQNIIEHAFVLCSGDLIGTQHLPRSVTGEAGAFHFRRPLRNVVTVSDRHLLAEAEADAIRVALARNHGHRGKTAAELGISVTTLWRKMRRLGLLSTRFRT